MVGVALLKYFIGFPFELTLMCKMQFHQLSSAFGSFNVTSQGLIFLLTMRAELEHLKVLWSAS